MADQKWGRNRIRYELKQKQVSDYCIKKAMKQIPDEEYEEVLKKLLLEKHRSLKADQWIIRKKDHRLYDPKRL